MAERSLKTRHWVAGCGLLALAPVMVVLVVTARTLGPLQSAGRDDDRLEELYGPPESFSPPGDGAISPARLEAFVEVRRALGPVCDRFRELGEPMEQVDSLDGDGVTGSDIAEATWGIAGVTVRITPLVGEFFKARNRALLASRMGLGEYSYIFSLAYHAQLRNPALQATVFVADEGPLAPRVHESLRAMLGHQLNAIPPDMDGARQALLSEIEALEQAPRRLPWDDGLPAVVAASLGPYRAQLDALFCPMPVGIELDRDSGRALKLALY